MKRIKTGIKGFDELIEGGLVKGSITLVSGAPGTGKSIFAMQFINEGLKNNEKCVYISVLSEKENQIIEEAKQFGFNLKKAKIITPQPEEWGVAIGELMKTIKPERMVIDSISAFTFSDEGTLRRFMNELAGHVKNDGNCTVIITSELPKESNYFSRDTVSEFISDGVVVLSKKVVGDKVERSLVVEKMRQTKIKGGIYPIEITKNGIVVKTK
ncbi:MAG: ATPase domain-containing protein [Candidatus Aenigmatarchaeota archaeon]